MKDTIIIKCTDSVTISKKSNGFIILIQDQPKESSKGWQENIWIVSFLIPVIVAFLIAWFTNKLNAKKNSTEIEKLKEETSNLKKSFQPIVVGTLQSIQDKIITLKVDALKSLVQIRNNFTYHEQQYFEGDPVTPDYDQYLALLFYNFSSIKYNDYSTFHDNYSYLFSHKTFNTLNSLYEKLSRLNEIKKSFDSLGDESIEPTSKNRKEIEEIIKLFKESILEIRKDCHLDTTFIHDFIEENKLQTKKTNN